jgi:hypothetical protein
MKYSFAVAAILGATTVLALPAAAPVPTTNSVAPAGGISTRAAPSESPSTGPDDRAKALMLLKYMAEHQDSSSGDGNSNAKRGAFDWMNDGGDWLNSVFSKRDDKSVEARGAFDWMGDGGDWLNSVFSKRSTPPTEEQIKTLMALKYISEHRPTSSNEKRGAFDWMGDGGDWLNSVFSKREENGVEARGAFDWMGDGGDWLNSVFSKRSTPPTEEQIKTLMALKYISDHRPLSPSSNEKRGAFDWMNDGGDWLNSVFSKRSTPPTEEQIKTLMALRYLSEHQPSSSSNEKRGAFDWMGDGGDWLNSVFSKRESEAAAAEASA